MALLPSSSESPASTSQGALSATAGLSAGAITPSLSPLSETRLAVDPGLFAVTSATATWIGVYSITGTTATPRITYSTGGGTHTVYLRYKTADSPTWNTSILSATSTPSIPYIPIVMTGLTPETDYEIEVTFDTSDWSPSKTKTFRTKGALATLPAVTAIAVSRISACQAQLRFYIPNLSGDSFLLYYRWRINEEGSTWINTKAYPSGGKGGSVNPGLSPSTTYVAQATLDPDFTEDIFTSEPFTTQDPPYVRRVIADPVGDTTAKLTASRENFCIVFPRRYFRYKVQETDAWTKRESEHSFLDLTGLTPLTTYVAEVSFSRDYSGAASTTFTTKAGEPSVGSIEVPDKHITQIGAKVIVRVDSPNGDKVYIRYSTDSYFLSGSTIRTGSQAVQDTASSAEFALSNLTSGTTYYVEASYDNNYPPDKTATADFLTAPPVITGVAANPVGKTTATVTVTVDVPNTALIQLHYKTAESAWTTATATTADTNTKTAVFDLAGLTSGTAYTAYASYDTTQPQTGATLPETQTVEFTTPSPNITGVAASGVTQTAATVTVTVDEPNTTPIQLHYKTAESTWTTANPADAVFSATDKTYTFNLASLTSGTAYTAYASYSTTQPQTGATLPDAQTAEFATSDPTVTGIEVADMTVTQTEATVTVTVTEPNGADVHIRYSTADSFPAGSTDTASEPALFAIGEVTVDLDLTELDAGSTYYVQAAYKASESDPFPASDTTNTTAFTTLDPNITEVAASGVTQTVATVTVTIDEPNSTPVQLHYKETSWSGPMSATADPSTKKATFALSELTSGTEYTVYASYDSSPPADGATLPDAQTDMFTTEPPSVEEVEATAKTDTTAVITITIAEPNGATQTVMVRYQPAPSGDLVTIQPDPTTDTDKATVNLDNLTANTQYKVEATLAGSFDEGVKETTFTTDSTGPGVSGVVMSDETQTGATATITIANAGATVRTVYLQYRESGTTTWSSPPEQGDSTTTGPDTAVINLSGLTSGTLYEVQASLVSTFAAGVQSATFSTKPPSATAVNVTERNPTTAKVRVTVSAPNGKATLFLRYGTSGTGFHSEVRMDEVGFTLIGLEPDSPYTVKASFDSGFPSYATATATFRTPHLRAPSVDVPTRTQTTATVEITFSSPSDQDGVVFLRYQEAPSGSWSATRAAVVTDGLATATLSGLTSFTEYKVEASLSRSFPSNATGSKIFTTEPPSVDWVEVTEKTETMAKVTVTIAAPNGKSQIVSLQYDTTSNTEQGTWGNDAPGESSDDTATIDLTGLSEGTQYTVRASLTDDTNNVIRYTTFTTSSNDPHVSLVKVADEDIEQTAATATITIANAGAVARTVHVRYQTVDPVGSWVVVLPAPTTMIATPETTTVGISGLTSGTQYKVHASLDNTFATGVQTATFTTKAPSVSSVNVSAKTRSTATVQVGVSHPNGGPVFLQYRTGSGVWIGRFVKVETGEASVEFGLRGLASGSTYTVQASYDSEFPATDATKTETFTTSRAPSVSRPSRPSRPSTSTPDVEKNDPPEFWEGSRTMRSVAENTEAGEKVGAPVPVGDDEEDTLTFTLVNNADSTQFAVVGVNFDVLLTNPNIIASSSELVAGDFDLIDDAIANSVQILTQTSLDYEAKNVYNVTIWVGDGMDSQGEEDDARDTSIIVTILVTDLEEPGTVTLSAPTARVGVPLRAAVTDPDGGVTDVEWQWELSEDQAEWTAISDATSASYIPTADDEGRFLRVTASYTDRRGPSKTASAQLDTAVRVGFDTEFTDVADTYEHAEAIHALASQGVFVDTECGDGLFCAELPLKRWAMSVWLLRVLADEPSKIVGTSRFDDVADGQWWIRHLERFADRKITVGCKLDPLRYCPHRDVARAQMASFLTRALALPPAPSAEFVDTADGTHTANIDSLFAAGITIGCDTEPLRFCPWEPVTRGQMASFLYRIEPWLDRQALTALYNATDGPNWRNSTNWLTDTPIAEWYGVETNERGRVTGLELAGNRLHGPVPPELVNLTALKNVELARNVLTGCLPDAWEDLPESDLSKLGLPYCQ